MKHIYITLKSGFREDLVIADDAAEDLELYIEEHIFKNFVFKTSDKEIISFTTNDIFQFKAIDCEVVIPISRFGGDTVEQET